MFTGLIEATGVVMAHSPTRSKLTILVPPTPPASSQDDPNSNNSDPSNFFKDVINIGDSISVNGACLTVISLSGNPIDSFSINLAPETLNRTNLASLNVNDRVNLERALSPTTRFGGHFVQGHVDTTAKLIESTPDEDSLRLTFELSSRSTNLNSAPTSTDEFSYLIPKGYITIDGISLTLTSTDPISRRFSIMLIPHTQQIVTLASKSVGMLVNIEFDMLVKSIVEVVERNLEQRIERIVQKTLADRL